MSDRLSAYSCGGSSGLGPVCNCRSGRTGFPFTRGACPRHLNHGANFSAAGQVSMARVVKSIHHHHERQGMGLCATLGHGHDERAQFKRRPLAGAAFLAGRLTNPPIRSDRCNRPVTPCDPGVRAGSRVYSAANWFIVLAWPPAFSARSPETISLNVSPRSEPTSCWCLTAETLRRISSRCTVFT